MEASQTDIDIDLMEPDNVVISSYASFRSSSVFWRKLSDCLIEMKLYKNYNMHTQTCLRAKHTHASCKTDLACQHSTHDNLTVIECEINKKKRCIFAEVNRVFEKNLSFFIFFIIFINFLNVNEACQEYVQEPLVHSQLI